MTVYDDDKDVAQYLAKIKFKGSQGSPNTKPKHNMKSIVTTYSVIRTK